MKRNLLLLAMAGSMFVAMAQRVTDKLDRGLIALPASGGGNLVSWRLLGEEYYDVTYNVYRDNEKIAESLSVSNFRDVEGKSTNSYTVSAVVRGIEQPQCKPVQAWSQSYKQIELKHEGILSTLIPNDACCADVDGDGELEILMKFDNESEMAQSYPKAGPVVNGKTTGEYTIFEVFKLNGDRLWWVNCGPNMGDFQNNEQNIVGYDWDCDGKSEVIMRLLEGSTVHYADGTSYTIGADGKNGTSWYNYRGATGGGTNWFMHDGKEFLVYCNGENGEILDIIDYPLARLEKGETDLSAAWGDGYGHRCSKFFFGAPYLDGHKPSIFLARGIYTQIKMCAFDVNAETHKLVKRWDWRQTNGGYWMWQGYHNFGIADVDEDGRDEIVYGSMVVDDCGKGLSTTGLGHGDAQHCSDFNPYTKGLEIYACNEDQPGNNYRDATTSKIYHRFNSGNDDGRAMMGNFTDDYPGSVGCSAREGAISSVTYGAISGLNTTGINTNFRIYWDGDLCSETFNYINGKNTEGCVAKYGSWSPIYTCTGSMTNNDTKGTPCYQGDILGDWREEIIMRDASNNVRIYSTPVATSYRIPTLWSDHQYRNAMVWQMCGYNQPPHLSYFIGKLEGITMAPPPLTNNGREIIVNGATIGAELDGKHVLLSENNGTEIALDEGAKPYILTLNVPSWVSGTAGTNYTAKEATINYSYYTCNVTAGSLAGNARLVKQGDGILNLPKTSFTHTGETNIWGGTLNFDGQMESSPLWLNRFTTLNSNGGSFQTITALYGSVIRPGGENNIGTLNADSLHLDFGSRIIIDMDSDKLDCLKLRALTTIKKSGTAWTQGGPEYLQPVIQIHGNNLKAGDYVIAECANMNGSITNLKIEGITDFKTGLKYEDGKLILTLGGTRGASSVIWTGQKSNSWDYATSENFMLSDSTADVFVHGDFVEFNDSAKKFTVNLVGDLRVDTLKFTNETKSYTLSGDGSIVSGALVKEGAGKLTIKNTNSYAGGSFFRGGVVVVSALANDVDETGALGVASPSSMQRMVFENGAELQTSAAVTNGTPLNMKGELGGVINNTANFNQQKAIYGTLLTKSGAGTLVASTSNSLTRMIIKQGTVQAQAGNVAKTIEFQGGALTDGASSSVTLHVPSSNKGTWTTGNRCNYSNRITGSGTLTIYCATEKGSNYYATRTPLALDLREFEGTIIPKATYSADGRFTLSTSNGSDKCTFNIPTGIFVQNDGKTFRIGQLAGTGELSGSCTFSNGASVGANTWQVGNDKSFSWSGKVTSNANFEKLGSGTMTVKGVWSNSGFVKINEGTLKVSSTANLGTGSLTVGTNGCLTGNMSSSSLSNSSYTINGILKPSLIEGYASGNLSFGSKDVTINSNGILQMCIDHASTSDTDMNGTTISDIKTLNLKGKIHITIQGDYVPQTGDQIRLWNNVTTVKGTPTIQIDGYECEFDLTHLTDGYIVINSAASGINNVHMDDENSLYNINGQNVEETHQLNSGAYIRNHKKIIIK